MSFIYQYPVIPEQIFSIIKYSEQARVYEIVKSLPDNSTVVEVGSALGGTACLIAATNPTLRVNCVDCFLNNYISDIWERIDLNKTIIELKVNIDANNSINIINNFFEIDPTGQLAFEYITKPYSNITLHKGYSPRDFNNWDTMIDIYIEDALHENPMLAANIEFWKKFVKPGGYIIGHDYEPEIYPNVVTEFNKLIQQGWIRISLTETLIILQKPSNGDFNG
jgi:cephalosporin hydroxylase